METTDFGKQVKKRLVDMEKTQKWLIEKVKEKTGMFFDDGYIYKILTGKRSAPKITASIKEILELE